MTGSVMGLTEETTSPIAGFTGEILMHQQIHLGQYKARFTFTLSDIVDASLA